MIRFSVLIPACKIRHLERAIASVLANPGDDIELVVVDDASFENPGTVVARFVDPRLRFLRLKENLGAADPTRTWNLALGEARGEFVVLVGDDDEIDPNYFEEMRRLIDRLPGRDIYRARLRQIDEAGRILALGFPLAEIESWDEFLYFRNTGRRSHSTSEMCLRSAALREIGGWPSMPCAIGSDDLAYLALAARSGIASTNATWASWRVHRAQISRARSREACRLRALKALGDRELEVLKKLKSVAVPADLLEDNVPGRTKRGTIDRLKSATAIVVGGIGRVSGGWRDGRRTSTSV